MKSCNDIYSVVSSVWCSLDENSINLLVKDFIRRCEIVLNLGGKSASQYISSHMEVAEKESVQVSSMQWSIEDDQILGELLEQYLNKWKEIGREMNRDPTEVKHRAKFLDQIKKMTSS